MQKHCEIGHRILKTPAAVASNFDATLHMSSANPLLSAAAEIALCHHERWDGTGYPNRISGTDIPVAARIVAVADVYDALTSLRPYKKPMPHAEALSLQLKESGRHFDPQLITLLASVPNDFNEIRQRFASPDPTECGSIASLRTLVTPILLSA